MSAGELLNAADRSAVEEALEQANALTDFTFNVSVEEVAGDARAHAIAQHAATVDPDNTVLIACDPVHRTLEIVTGRATHRTLQDSDCQFAAAGMVSNLRAGDYAGGLIQGVGQLAEAARSLRVLHARDAREL